MLEGAVLDPMDCLDQMERELKVPVVVRMEGTNVELGQQILRDSGLNFTIANGMKDGAQKVVALAGGAR